MRKRKIFALLLAWFILGTAAAGAAGQKKIEEARKRTPAWCVEMMRDAWRAERGPEAEGRRIDFWLAWGERKPGEIRKCFQRSHTPIPRWLRRELREREEAARSIPPEAQWLFKFDDLARKMREEEKKMREEGCNPAIAAALGEVCD